jgi:RHS repeat-associated protein
MTYGYNNVGNVLSVTDSINSTVDAVNTQQYDALNRLTVNTQGNKRVDYAYNAISQVTNKKRYSDATGTNLVAETNHTYDSVNRLTNITHSKGANTIASYTQSYDADSKITSITSSDGSSTYTYDDTDQITGADYNYQPDENYSYDANGNRTNTGYVTGINNQLLEDSKYRYEYDKVGNRTKRTDKSTNEVTEYTWDIRDRLTGIRVINALGEVIRTANYVYDVYDQRIAKIVDSDGDGSGVATTERFVYGTNQNIALVFDGSGNLTNRYMFGNAIDQIEADEKVSTGTTLWALTDHLGSVRDVVDSSGTVQNHIVYDSFGNITSQSNSSVIFRFGYTAREFDAESGLQYNRARYLDTFTGRFISEDKIGFGGEDLNLYRYVENSPIIFIDPTGLFRVLPRPFSPTNRPSTSPNRSAPFIFPKLPNPNQANPFEQPNTPPRNFVRPSNPILPVTPVLPRPPDHLFIPLPRSGQQRKSKKKIAPNPNVCDVRPKNGCPDPEPTFHEDPSLTEHYTLVTTAIQRDNQPIYLQRADSVVNEFFNRPTTNKYYGKNIGSANKYSLTGSKANWDEYPYSSTVEGGFGATLSSVDEKENRIAGLKLQAFYTFNKIAPGCHFFVSL